MKEELKKAIQSGNLEAVRSLIKKETINVPDEKGNSPLKLAILSEKTNIALFLLEQDGIDVNQVNKQDGSKTALQLANEKSNDVVFERLLFGSSAELPANLVSNNSKINEHIKMFKQREKEDEAILQTMLKTAEINLDEEKEAQKALDVYEACKYLGEYYSKQFIKNPSIESHKKAEAFFTRVYQIFSDRLTSEQKEQRKEGGSILENFRLIINKMFPYNYRNGIDKTTPIMWAVSHNTPIMNELASYLIGQPNVDLISESENGGKTVLDIAVINGNMGAVLELILKDGSTQMVPKSSKHAKGDMLNFINVLSQYQKLNAESKPETLPQRASLANQISKLCFKYIADKKIADLWLSKAAELGDVESMQILAWAYQNGSQPRKLVSVATIAPIRVPSDSNYSLNSVCQALDSVNSWREATVIGVKDDLRQIHYNGWQNKWDEWISVSSDRLASLGTHAVVPNSSRGTPAIPQILATATHIPKDLEKSVNFYFKSYLLATTDDLRNEIIKQLKEIASLSIDEAKTDIETAGIYDANMKLANIYLRTPVKVKDGAFFDRALGYIQKSNAAYSRLTQEQLHSREKDTIVQRMNSDVGRVFRFADEAKESLKEIDKPFVVTYINFYIALVEAAKNQSEVAYLWAKNLVMRLSNLMPSVVTTAYLLTRDKLGDAELKEACNNILKSHPGSEKAFKYLFEEPKDLQKAAFEFKELAENAKKNKQFIVAAEFYRTRAISLLTSQRKPEEAYVKEAILSMDAAFKCEYLEPSLTNFANTKFTLRVFALLINLFKHDKGCFTAGVDTLQHCYKGGLNIQVPDPELQNTVTDCLQYLTSKVKDSPELLAYVVNASLTCLQLDNEHKELAKFKKKKEQKEESSAAVSDDFDKLNRFIALIDQPSYRPLEDNKAYRRELISLLKKRAAHYEGKDDERALADYNRLKELNVAVGFYKSAQLILQKDPNNYSKALEMYRDAVNVAREQGDEILAKQVIDDLKARYKILPKGDHEKPIIGGLIESCIRVILQHKPELAVSMREEMLPFLSGMHLTLEAHCLEMVDDEKKGKDELIGMLTDTPEEGAEIPRNLAREAMLEWINIENNLNTLTQKELEQLITAAVLEQRGNTPDVMLVVNMIEAKLKAMVEMGESKSANTNSRQQLLIFYRLILPTVEGNEYLYAQYENKLVSLLADSFKMRVAPAERKAIIEELSTYRLSKSLPNRLIVQEAQFQEAQTEITKSAFAAKIATLAKEQWNVFAMMFLAENTKTPDTKILLSGLVLIGTAGVFSKEHDIIVKKALKEIETPKAKTAAFFATWVKLFYDFLQKNPSIIRKVIANKMSINDLIMAAMDKPNLFPLPSNFNMEPEKLKKEFAKLFGKAMDGFMIDMVTAARHADVIANYFTQLDKNLGEAGETSGETNDDSSMPTYRKLLKDKRLQLSNNLGESSLPDSNSNVSSSSSSFLSRNLAGTPGIFSTTLTMPMSESVEPGQAANSGAPLEEKGKGSQAPTSKK